MARMSSVGEALLRKEAEYISQWPGVSRSVPSPHLPKSNCVQLPGDLLNCSRVLGEVLGFGDRRTCGDPWIGIMPLTVAT